MDMIPNEVLKNLTMKEFLHKFFNLSLINKCMPSGWNLGIIKPIPKGADKDPNIPLNYRGITLLPCIYKVFSTIINQRIILHLEQNGLLADEQNGFRAKRSCTDHLYTCTTIVRDTLENNRPTYCAFIDLQKAFDRVNRDLLWYKLDKIGISGRMFNIIKRIYQDPKSQVQITHNLSTPWFSTPVGVRQGDSLSPTLFNIYINDLISELNQRNHGIDVNGEKICALLYADDLLIMGQSAEQLQDLLDSMYGWCRKWKLLINVSKSNIIHFRKTGTKETNYMFKWGQVPLEKVNCYKYLGLYLFSDMNFSKTARLLSESATRALGSLISKYKSAKFMHYHTYTKLFNSLVCPITEYGAGIWGLGEFENINKILLTACRTYLGAHRHVAKTCLVADMGWVSDYNRRQIEMLRTWNRLIKLPKDRITYKIFQWSYERNSAWCRDIQEVFSRCKMLDVYLNKITCNLSEAKEEFLKAQERQFKTETLFKPKLKLYRKIKQTYNNTEAFVSNVNNRKSRSLITLLRAGCLPLEVEIGRWYNVPRESRICKLCTSGEVEDEVHFIFSCGALKETRDTYAESLQFDFDQTASHTINEIESFMTDPKVVKQFARFITAMYETRKNILYKNTTV